MNNIFTSKFTLIMAGFGAVLSLLLSLFAGTSALQLLLRLLLSTLIMGGIAILIQFLITKFIPQEHLDILMKGGQNSDSSTDGNSTQNEESGATGSSIDYTDDSTLSVDELYQSEDEEASSPDTDYKPASRYSPSTSTSDDQDNIFPAHNSSDPDAGSADDDSDDSFKATDFSEAPRLKTGSEESTSSEDSRDEDDAPSPSPSASLEEKAIPFDDGPAGIPMNPSPKNTYEKGNTPPPTGGGGDVSFTVDNKKITTDPKIIAKAIRTVLYKDS